MYPLIFLKDYNPKSTSNNFVEILTRKKENQNYAMRSNIAMLLNTLVPSKLNTFHLGRPNLQAEMTIIRYILRVNVLNAAASVNLASFLSTSPYPDQKQKNSRQF
jgi:hypothetical protein